MSKAKSLKIDREWWVQTLLLETPWTLLLPKVWYCK